MARWELEEARVERRPARVALATIWTLILLLAVMGVMLGVSNGFAVGLWALVPAGVRTPLGVRALRRDRANRDLHAGALATLLRDEDA